MAQSQPTPARSGALKPLLFIGAVVIGVALIVATSRKMPPEVVPWGSDYQVAVADAHSSHKPILLYFTASWCGPCQEMRRYVWSDSDVADAIKPFIPVRIDVDQEPALAKRYQVEAMPTFILLTSDEHIGKVKVGGMDADQMVNWLKSANP